MIVAISMGMILGVLTGLFPGIGTASLILSVYMILLQFDLVNVLLFYIALMSTLSYYGNISAIIFGVHGEITSGPAVEYGHELFKKNQQDGTKALIYTATSSFIGSIFAIFVMLFMFFNLDFLIPLFSNFVKVVILTVAIVALVSLCQNKFLGILFTMIGLLLGKIGYDNLFQTRILTVDHSNLLDAGIPFISLFIGLVVLPQLWELIKNKKAINYSPTWNDVTLLKRVKILLRFPYVYSVMRGSIIGIFTGVIPGVSYAISSSTAAAIEKNICIYNKNKQRDINFKCVISAETANNTASIVVLIPLLMLALPIIPSEAIIFSIAENKGFGVATSRLFLETYGLTIFWVLLFANTINWVFSGIFYVIVSRFYFLVKDYIYYFLFGTIICVNYYAATLTNSEFLATIFLLIFFLLGLIVKDINTKSTMVFAFFLADPLVNEIYRFWLLNT